MTQMFNFYTPNLRLHTHMNTRGHAQNHLKLRANKNTRKHFFTLRVCNLWNSLPGHVVESKDVFQFEKWLDLWWQNLELKFDYEVPRPDRANSSDVRRYYHELDIEEHKILRPELNST